MLPVPWTDNGGSLANRLFRELVNAGTVVPEMTLTGVSKTLPFGFLWTGPPLIMFIGWGILQ